MNQEAPKILKENVNVLLNEKYIKVYDLQYAPGKHYMDASRREMDSLVAVKSEENFKEMLPDAVSCFVILKTKQGPRLLLSRE